MFRGQRATLAAELQAFLDGEESEREGEKLAGLVTKLVAAGPSYNSDADRMAVLISEPDCRVGLKS